MGSFPFYVALACMVRLCGMGYSATLFASPIGTSQPQPPYATSETAADSIQTALDYSAPGDTVFALAGVYEEKLLIDKSLTLIGEGKDHCTVANPDPSPRSDNVTLLVNGDAIVQGLTITGGHYGVVLDGHRPFLGECRISGARVGVECRSGFPTISLCEILQNDWGGVRAKGPSSPSISHCDFRRNGLAIDCECDCAPIISHCVVIGNRGGILTNGPVAYIQRCLVVLNGGGVTLGSDCDTGGLIWRCTIALNGYWDGVYVDSRTRGAVLEECIVWSPPFGRIQGYIDPTNVRRTLANDAQFESAGVLLTDDPGFVGWGPFNNTDNPINVDASAPPGGHGTAERPFISLSDAMWSFDFRLAADSPAIEAFGHGGVGQLLQPIGYYAGEPLAEQSGSLAVTLKIAPGTYVEPSIALPEGSNVLGEGSSRPVLRPEYSSEYGATSRLSVRQGRLEHLTFDGYSAHCSDGRVADCDFASAELGLDSTEVTRCKFTGKDAKLWIRGGRSLVQNCVFQGIRSIAVDVLTEIENPAVQNCTFHDCTTAIYVSDSPVSLPPVVVNSIFSLNMSDINSYVPVPVSYSLLSKPYPGEGNIAAAPLFLDPEGGNLRLLPDSPCMDAGFNSPDLPEFDIAGMHRIMFGGKTLTVDMGAYEFYINKLDPVPGTDEAVFTWTSLADKTYSIFYTDDLFNWHTAIANFPSSGNQTTSWLDDGSLTGLPPGLSPKRFYRLLENP